MEKIKMESSWKAALAGEFSKAYMADLKQFLAIELKKKKPIYPAAKHFFAALDYTPVDQVKVVILGQDPYHGPSQAHGLCFSVRPGVDVPPSLKNIYKELKSDLGIQSPDHGCLLPWAKQGVLLLNATLSVEAGKAGSHQGKGWENFTDSIIKHVNDNLEGVVFVLWGAYAQKKGAIIDRQRHFVIEAPHPSPLSSHRGFFGSKPFSKINSYLKSRGESPIDWQLPPRSELQLES